MRKLFTILVYTFVVLLIGRNMTSLPRFTLFTNASSYTEDLKKEIVDLVDKKQGNYGVYFINLKDNTNFGISEDMTFTAASINKVQIVTALYVLSEKGEFDLDEQITLQKRDIQDYGTGTLRYQKPGSVYSLRTLAKLALNLSDNTAAHILSEKVGSENIQDMVESWGMTQTSMEENKTTPKDMGVLFQKLYRNELTSEALSKEILGFMNETDIEDRLPRLLPNDAVVYHKTGDAVGTLHDAGIIQRGGSVFYLGVFSSDVGKDEQAAKDTISEIAQKAVVFYENRR